MHQSGIFQENTSHHVFLEFGFRDESSRVPGCALAAEPVEGGVQVIAFGQKLIPALTGLSKPPGLCEFTAIDGPDGVSAPATQQDLFVWLHGRKRDELFARALQWRDTLTPVADLTFENHGFRFRDNRDLTGFVDGTENPKDDARMAVALVSNGVRTGGSFVLAQRWVHNLSHFNTLSVGDQERVIGRTKPDSVELTGDAMPEDSHVSRTDLERDGKAIKIYRRSSPVGGVRDAGLYFLAFSADVNRFRWLLESMFGFSDDGRHDRLLSYSQPITGSFFYAPPKNALLASFHD